MSLCGKTQVPRYEYEHGDSMIRNDNSEQKVDEREPFLPPGLFFVILPAFLSLLGVLVLSRLSWLIGAYNYLRGAPSLIDQSVLTLLGSDFPRVIILISGIIGMLIGLYLSRVLIIKLDAVRKEGEARISVRTFFALQFQWAFFFLPISAIGTLDLVVYGYPTSSFLIDLAYFGMSSFFVAFTIPVLLKYIFLVMHARSIDSQIRLIEHRNVNGFIKLRFLTLRIIYDGPDS
jgi:hypothetical protein